MEEQIVDHPTSFSLQQQSDIEWKYGLAKLIRNMHRTNASPAPINLVTTWTEYIRSALKSKQFPPSPMPSTLKDLNFLSLAVSGTYRKVLFVCFNPGFTPESFFRCEFLFQINLVTTWTFTQDQFLSSCAQMKPTNPNLTQILTLRANPT